jgi:hypothetical protein
MSSWMDPKQIWGALPEDTDRPVTELQIGIEKKPVRTIHGIASNSTIVTLIESGAIC